MDIFEIDETYTGMTTNNGTLTVSQTDTGSYGNNFDGQTDADGALAFTFDTGGRGMVIDFDAYDIDYHGEIAVYVNGVWVGIADLGVNNGMSDGRVVINDEYIYDGTNYLQFVVAGDSDDTWGVTNILISPEPALLFNEFEDGIYGSRFDGVIDTDGTVSFQFFFEPTEDLTLYLQGFDIDYYGEVRVFLNGKSIGYLSATENNGLGGSRFDISMEDLLSGGNEIEFVMQDSLKRAWGVTDLVFLNQGTNVSTMKIDPEFTDDGWVTWQEADKIYLGKYDTNSGMLMEVVNESVGGALPFYITYYGSELLETSDGVVALGITDHGIIYLDEHDSYILPGTEGFRVGFLPKGVTDGLRFTMVDLDYWVYDGGVAEVYLYDNGDVSLIDFGDNTTRAVTWINHKEVLSFSETHMGIYNVETGVMEWVAENTYDEGYVAAFQMSNGEKVFSALHDDGFTDIWALTNNGWEIYHRLHTPDEIFGQYMFSPEFVEYDGDLYLMAISAELPTTTDLTAIVMYNIMEDTWSQVGDVIYGFDPEVFVLEWGFSFYFRNSAEGITEWFNVSFEEMIALEIPGLPSEYRAAEAPEAPRAIDLGVHFHHNVAVEALTPTLIRPVIAAADAPRGLVRSDVEVAEVNGAEAIGARAAEAPAGITDAFVFSDARGVISRNLGSNVSTEAVGDAAIERVALAAP